jgi:hypothetical protein
MVVGTLFLSYQYNYQTWLTIFIKHIFKKTSYEGIFLIELSLMKIKLIHVLNALVGVDTEILKVNKEK